MKSAVFIFAALNFFQYNLAAQNTITFKGQVLNTSFSYQQKLRLMINQRYVTTNDSGFFQLILPKTNTHLQLSIPSGEYVVIYPLGGYITIPRKLTDITRIIIGRAHELIPFKEYLRVYRLRKTAKEFEKESLQLQMNSIKTSLLKLGITKVQLENAERAEAERENYLATLSADVMLFRRRVFALQSNYKWLADKSLEDGTALQTILDAVNDYNKSYNKFDRQHAVYENMELKFWNNKDLLPHIKQFSEFLILKIHAENIYPMQESILQIRQFYSGKKKDRQLRKTIEEEIVKQAGAVEQVMPTLDSKTREFLMTIAVE